VTLAGAMSQCTRSKNTGSARSRSKAEEFSSFGNDQIAKDGCYSMAVLAASMMLAPTGFDELTPCPPIIKSRFESILAGTYGSKRCGLHPNSPHIS
jgi:hypothetical protein